MSGYAIAVSRPTWWSMRSLLVCKFRGLLSVTAKSFSTAVGAPPMACAWAMTKSLSGPVSVALLTACSSLSPRYLAFMPTRRAKASFSRQKTWPGTRHRSHRQSHLRPRVVRRQNEGRGSRSSNSPPGIANPYRVRRGAGKAHDIKTRAALTLFRVPLQPQGRGSLQFALFAPVHARQGATES